MRELDDILSEWQKLEGSNRGAVLATVVHVTGSAYRRPGARMLLIPDGRRIGSISGGCLEGEIGRKAWWYTDAGRAVVRVYDTTSDDDATWEFGLGCNGVVHVMLERSDSTAVIEMMKFVGSQRAAAQPCAVATVVGGGKRIGQRLLLNGAGKVCGGALEASGFEGQLMPHIYEVLTAEKSRLVHLAEGAVFVEWIGPPQAVVIFGAGHDAIPLAMIAQQLGWKVTVADGRPAYARPERFPGAEHVVVMSGPDLLRDIAIDRKTAVVMMTHNYPLDRRLLARVVAARPAYLGMLGPKSRAEKLFTELEIAPPPELHAPVGLDIGSDDPSAIALAIAGEIQAELAGRSGGRLRERFGAIHSPAFEFGPHADAVQYETMRPEYCETLAGSNV